VGGFGWGGFGGGCGGVGGVCWLVGVFGGGVLGGLGGFFWGGGVFGWGGGGGGVGGGFFSSKNENHGGSNVVPKPFELTGRCSSRGVCSFAALRRSWGTKTDLGGDAGGGCT